MAGKSPNLRSYTVYIYSTGQTYTYVTSIQLGSSTGVQHCDTYPTCETALRAAMPDWAVPDIPTHFNPAAMHQG